MKKEIDLIKEILRNKSKRLEQIQIFQELVWNDDHANPILSELAYILDFYEPNSIHRKEDLSYYGDMKLEEILDQAISNLQKK